MRKYGLPERKPKKKAIDIDKRHKQTSCDFCSYKIKKVNNFEKNSLNLIQDTTNKNFEGKTNDEVQDQTVIDNVLVEDHTAIDDILKKDNTGINGDLEEDLTIRDNILEEDNTVIDDILDEDLTIIDDVLKTDHTIINDILEEDNAVISNIQQDLIEIENIIDDIEESVPLELDCTIQPSPVIEKKKLMENKKRYLKSIKKYFKPRPPAPKRILFECGVGNGFTFATNNNGTSMTQSGMCFRPKTVASVAIDSTSLVKPKAKIEFSSNVHFVRIDPCNSATAEVEFELIRLSKNKVKSSLDTWLYCISNEASNIAEIFSFIYCDCNSCPEGCRYFVLVTPIQLENVNLSIVNCHISAIAQSRCDS